MTEQQLRDKLTLIADTLRRFEENADRIGKLLTDTAYWDGRKEALRDIRDHIGSLKEFETNAETTTTATMARPAAPADRA